MCVGQLPVSDPECALNKSSTRLSSQERAKTFFHPLWRTQLPLPRMITFAVLAPVSVLFLALPLQQLIPMSELLRDPNATAYDAQNRVMFYRGTISSEGILLWWAAASVYAFAAYLYRPRSGIAAFSPPRVFLGYMAVLTGLLALDDLFMIHEELLPVHLGIPEVSVYVLYGVLVVGLAMFVLVLLNTDFLVLGLALGFFAFSMVTDMGLLHALVSLPDGAFLLVEDLTKMLGIVCWFIFSLRTSACLLRRDAST